MLRAGLRIRHLGTDLLTWDDLRDFVRHVPEDSATYRAAYPDHLPAAVHLLREIEHGVRVLFWAKTEDARRAVPSGYPARIPLTPSERQAVEDASPPEVAPLPIDEMNDWLGWPERPTAKGA